MIEVGLVALLVVLGFVFGRRVESKHLRSIIEREQQLNSLPAIASRFPPTDQPYQQQLVVGSVVVSSDYFKTFLASLINLFGGAIVSYESLLDRGRREALLRMKAEAKKLHATYVFNVKLTTASVGGNRAVSVEVLAYGTALTPTASNAL